MQQQWRRLKERVPSCTLHPGADPEAGLPFVPQLFKENAKDREAKTLWRPDITSASVGWIRQCPVLQAMLWLAGLSDMFAAMKQQQTLSYFSCTRTSHISNSTAVYGDFRVCHLECLRNFGWQKPQTCLTLISYFLNECWMWSHPLMYYQEFYGVMKPSQFNT